MFSMLRWLRRPAAAAALPLARPAAALSAFAAVAPMSPLPVLARGMKVMSAIRKRCADCYFVRRGNIAFVYCKTHPRHKARQGPKRRQGKPQAPPANSSSQAADVTRGVRGGRWSGGRWGGAT